MARPAMLQQSEQGLRPFTFEDYLALPDDGVRYEVINGELFMSPSAIMLHQLVSGRLFTSLTNILHEADGLVFSAPFDVHLDRYNLVQPDLVVVLREHFDVLAGGARIEGVPDLVIEILSPSNRAHDLVKKMTLYAQHRIPEYWVVDPILRSIAVHVIDGDGYALQTSEGGLAHSRILPGFVIDPGKLFQLPEGLNRGDGE